jgi:hypothetical protein
MRHLVKKNRPGAPLFHIHTPEQVHSFLTDEITSLWFRQAKSMKMPYVKWLKPMIYEKHFPNIVPRQKKTGIELIQPLDNELMRPKLESMNGQYNQYIKINTNKILEIVEAKTDKFWFSNANSP